METSATASAVVLRMPHVEPFKTVESSFNRAVEKSKPPDASTAATEDVTHADDRGGGAGDSSEVDNDGGRVQDYDDQDQEGGSKQSPGDEEPNVRGRVGGISLGLEEGDDDDDDDVSTDELVRALDILEEHIDSAAGQEAEEDRPEGGGLIRPVGKPDAGRDAPNPGIGGAESASQNVGMVSSQLQARLKEARRDGAGDSVEQRNEEIAIDNGQQQQQPLPVELDSALATLEEIKKSQEHLVQEVEVWEQKKSKREGSDISGERLSKKIKTGDKIAEPKGEEKAITSKTKRALEKKLGKTIRKMARSDLEELITTKVVEVINNKAKIGHLRQSVDFFNGTMDKWKEKIQMLGKQVKDLDTVVRRFIAQAKANPRGNVVPVRITRSVGLQVMPLERRLQMQKLQQQQQMPPENRLLAPTRQPPENRILAPTTRQQQSGQCLRPPSTSQVPAVRPVPTTPSAAITRPPVTVSRPPVSVTRPPVATTRPPMATTRPPVATPRPPMATTRPAQAIVRPRVNLPTTASRLPGVETRPVLAVMPTRSKAAASRTINLPVPKSKVVDVVDLSDDEPPTPPPPVPSRVPVSVQPRPRAPKFERPQTVPPPQRLPGLQPQQRIGAVGGQEIQGNGPPRPLSRRRPILLTRPLPARAPLAHPAPLPHLPNGQFSSPDGKLPPPKPSLKLCRVDDGIVVSWNMAFFINKHSIIHTYQIYAYQETAQTPSPSLWKKVGDVMALPLPMACTLTHFKGNKYHFAVRAMDMHGRVGHFSKPASMLL